MKMKLFGAAALAAMGLSATSALAATAVVSLGGGETVKVTAVQQAFQPGAPGGYVMVDDFTNPVLTGFTFTNNNAGATSATLPLADSAPPPGDGTAYETVLGSDGDGHDGSATLSSALGFTSFSFYMGSPDSYNNATITFDGGAGVHTLSGVDIWGGITPLGGFGTQTDGYLIIYAFQPGKVNSINFTSSQNSFEFDSLAVGVPEPASWALMIGGFGLAGATLRAKRRQAATA